MCWFKSFLHAIPRLLLLQSVCCNADLDIPLCSTSLHDDYVLEKITQAELRQHTFSGATTQGVARKQCKSKMRNHGFHGFLLFSNMNSVPKTVEEEDREEWDSIFHDKLPALLKTKAYKRKFSPTFARVEGDEYNRFGDKLRLQLKLKVALRFASDRLKSKTGGQKKAQAEYDLVLRAQDLLSKHYRALAQVMFCVPLVLCAETQLSMIIRTDVSARGAKNNRQRGLCVVYRREGWSHASRHSSRLIHSRLVVSDSAGARSGAPDSLERLQIDQAYQLAVR